MSSNPPGPPPGPGGPGGPAHQPPVGPSPPGAAPATGGNRQTVLLLVLLVLVVGIIVVGGVLAFGGGDDGEDTATGGGEPARTPVETLRGYYDALHERDCTAWVDHVDEATWSRDGATTTEEAVADCEARMTEMALEYAGVEPINAREVHNDGELARVRYDERQNVGAMSLLIDLVLEDGRWRVTEDITFV